MSYRVFISYRRNDGNTTAAWLASELERELERDDIFLDRSQIEPGEVFSAVLEKAVNVSPVFICLIGPRWNEVIDGVPRLQRSGDYVRRELTLAIAGAKSIIPVLHDGARMPAADLLPEDIRSIRDHHCLDMEAQRQQVSMSELVGRVIDRLDSLDETPFEERWIMNQISNLLSFDERRVKSAGRILAANHPEIIQLVPTTRRGLAHCLYRIGPLAVSSLLPFAENDRVMESLVELLATKWIRSPEASRLRENLLQADRPKAAAVECMHPDFTPAKMLLKASHQGRNWPSVHVKTSDPVEEILEQIAGTLARMFQNTSIAGARAGLNDLLHRYAMGKRFPVILKLDHRAGMDYQLVRTIQNTFPALKILVSTPDFDELSASGLGYDCFKPYGDAADDEDEAYFDYLDAKQSFIES
ncbi:hypothetical protein GCM10023212_12270 [Luteolibacter yonseiensis]|nr:toll/interleukin-1 receptor domain-containing protein [Luteolibacter yonseiensis]